MPSAAPPALPPAAAGAHLPTPAAFLARVQPGTTAVGHCRFEQWWLPQSPAETVTVVAERIDATHWQAAVLDHQPGLPGAPDPWAWVARAGAAALRPDRPWPLQPVVIAKPWGAEHWYTGIEVRGTSAVGGPGCRTALPRALALAPEQLAGPHARRINLLKVLAPFAEPGCGELYLETHREKREVYIVTGVDRAAWPDGHGAVRHGIDPARRAAAGDAAMRSAFGAALAHYESARLAVDAAFEPLRAAAGIGSEAAVPPALQRAWRAALPPALVETEATAAAAVRAFTRAVPLAVGDVVEVPPGLPHGLLHGVRVVEFQSPVYERAVLASSQKVVGQPRWDHPVALAAMRLDAPPVASVTVIDDRDGVRVERIARFDDFEARRLTLAAGAALDLPAAPYLLLMGLQAMVEIGGTRLAGEQAALLPGSLRERRLRNPGAVAAQALLAVPQP